jgi:opacity protein-like surface antigen
MICLVAALACACGQALTAAELDDNTTYRYGVRFTTASPRQDFRDFTGRTGLGAGVFIETDAGSGWIAQTRFDYITFPQTNNPDYAAGPAATPAITLSVDSASLGVDLRHPLSFAGLDRFYVLGGVMGIRYEFDASIPNTQVDQNGIPIAGILRYKDKTSFKLGLAVGVGFEIYRGLALTERYTTFDVNGTTLATLETSLSYRF